MIDDHDIESAIKRLGIKREEIPQSEKLAIALGGVVLDRWTARRAELKKEKLQRYAEKDLKTFFQIDVHDVGVNGGDDLMRPDKDGHCITWGKTRELMDGASVRVLIALGEDTKDVIAMLQKVVGNSRSFSPALSEAADSEELIPF
ncbi:MAG: hypothetical protein ACREYC_26560 [Gammaproteobacteria bacterium]